MRTITAFFDDRSEANRAQEQLRAIGVSDVDIIDQGSPGYMSEGYSTSENRGFWASLKDMFLPDADRHAYEEGVRRGGYLLTARTDESDADRVIDILDDEGTVDMQQRQDQWRQEGWSAPSISGGSMGTSAYGGSTASAGSTMDRGAMADRETSEERIPLMEEELRVGKREVARGGVRVHSYVVETPVHEQVTLRDEHVSVERRPVAGATGATGAIEGDAFRERSVEMTETAEEAVVDKRARVREEVVVRKDVEEHVENIDDSIRRTEVDIDRGAGTDRLAAEGSTNREGLDSDPSRRDRLR
jgi:uncharacterized protein (TIGR02271 family)